MRVCILIIIALGLLMLGIILGVMFQGVSVGFMMIILLHVPWRMDVSIII